MSERERVMEYLNKRIIAAWEDGRFEEAQDCNHFLNGLEVLSDEEYHELYGNTFGKVI